MTEPPILPGCTVLSPMDPTPSPNGANGLPHQTPARHQGHQSKAKGKPARRKTADRFAVLNAFVDCTMADLSRAESLVWLVLYRDTKPDGTARTGAADVARRIGTTRRAVVNALAKLRRRGLLRVVFKGGLNRGPSRYVVFPLPSPPDSK